MRSAVITVILYAVIGIGICYVLASIGKAAGMTTGTIQGVAVCILGPIGFIFWKVWRDS